MFLSKPIIKIAQTLWDLSILGMDRGKHIVRYAMYNRIEKATGGFHYDGQVLSISYSDYLCRLIGAKDGSSGDSMIL